MSASAGTVGALATLPNITVGEKLASRDKVTHGKRPVIDAKVSYPNATDDLPNGVACERIPESIVRSGNLYTVRASLRKMKSDEPLLRTPLRQRRIDGSLTYEEKVPFKEVTWDGLSDGFLHKAPGYVPVSVGIEWTDGTAAVTIADQNSIYVPAGAERSVSLPSRTVQTKKGTSSVTPTLSVRNNGLLTVFGVADGTVLPAVDAGIAQRLVGPANATLRKVEETDVIVIDYDYSDNRGEN